jgi:ribosomal protein S17E
MMQTDSSRFTKEAHDPEITKVVEEIIKSYDPLYQKKYKRNRPTVGTIAGKIEKIIQKKIDGTIRVREETMEELKLMSFKEDKTTTFDELLIHLVRSRRHCVERHAAATTAEAIVEVKN